MQTFILNVYTNANICIKCIKWKLNWGIKIEAFFLNYLLEFLFLTQVLNCVCIIFSYDIVCIVFQRNTVINNINKDRRMKYQHPKGAPDADVIFGNKPPTGGSRWEPHHGGKGGPGAVGTSKNMNYVWGKTFPGSRKIPPTKIPPNNRLKGGVYLT